MMKLGKELGLGGNDLLDLIVSVPDHCFSFYLIEKKKNIWKSKKGRKKKGKRGKICWKGNELREKKRKKK